MVCYRGTGDKNEKCKLDFVQNSTNMEQRQKKQSYLIKFAKILK